MNPTPRQLELLEEVRRLQTVTVEALAERFGVTLQTVRRDVRQLTDAGVLTRFHGGVRLPGSTTENIEYRKRQQLNAQAKQRIARQVALRVPHGSSLLINIGTTTEAIARALLQHKGLRVITNNLNVAAILSDNTDCEVIVAGGVVRSRDRGIVGEVTVDFIAQFKVDIGLIGISGIESDGSLRAFDYREVKVARAILAHSREVWVATDHSKFNRPAMVEVARFDQVEMLFTDAAPPAPFPTLLAQAGVTLVESSELRNAPPTSWRWTRAPRARAASCSTPTARCWRWRNASSASSFRNPAGSSTTRARSWPASSPPRTRRWPGRAWRRATSRR